MSDDEMVSVPRAEWEALVARVARLEEGQGAPSHELAAPLDDQAAGDRSGEQRTDRRGLLKHGAMLAAGAVAGGAALALTGAEPASATTGTMFYGTGNDSGSTGTYLRSSSSAYVLALQSTYTGSDGTYVLRIDDGTTLGLTTVGTMLLAEISNSASDWSSIIGSTAGTGPGVTGVGQSGPGSSGRSVSGPGVYGQTMSGTGVVGDDTLYNESSGTGSGVVGQIYNPANSSSAMQALTAGTGSALDARITNGSNENPAVFATTVGSAPAIWGQQTSGLDAAAVYGDSSISGGPGVQGVSGNTGVAGVLGQGLAGPGVQGDILESFNASPAVTGSTGGTGQALYGEITNASSNANAIEGVTNGTGSGVFGQITNASSGNSAVVGLTNGTGAALSGVSSGSGAAMSALVFGGTGPALSAQISKKTNSQPVVAAVTNGTGPALQGKGGTTGRGAVLSGGPAQLQLTPSTAATHPSAGQAGDLFLDSSSRLWLCTTTGSPATWKQVQVA